MSMQSYHWRMLPLLLLLLAGSVSSRGAVTKIDKRSPLYLRLPDCRDEATFTRLHKRTSTRAVVCSSFKNEGGFLSEFLAYNQMHGIDHIRLYDQGSKDEGIAEIEPWLKSGYASIEEKLTGRTDTDGPDDKDLFYKQCKIWAQEKGYDYIFNLDVDEYIVPIEDGITVIDALDSHVQISSQSVVTIPKLRFQSAPHTLEPIDLLTIEAYHLRMSDVNQLTYFKNVSSKVALRINHPSYHDVHREYIVHCCNVFGCELKRKRCKDAGAESGIIHGMAQPNGVTHDMKSPVVIFHYTRSLEKFELQYSVNKDNGSEGTAAQGQNVGKYMDQSLGVERDFRAAGRYGCQLREILKQATGEEVYLRPGPYWYRNVVYGKALKDGRKGKRNGKPIKGGNKVWSDNPYEYHGFYKRKIRNGIKKGSS